MDDEIYSHFRELFETLSVEKIDEDEMKSPAGKVVNTFLFSHYVLYVKSCSFYIPRSLPFIIRNACINVLEMAWIL